MRRLACIVPLVCFRVPRRGRLPFFVLLPKTKTQGAHGVFCVCPFFYSRAKHESRPTVWRRRLGRGRRMLFFLFFLSSMTDEIAFLHGANAAVLGKTLWQTIPEKEWLRTTALLYWRVTNKDGDHFSICHRPSSFGGSPCPVFSAHPLGDVRGRNRSRCAKACIIRAAPTARPCHFFRPSTNGLRPSGLSTQGRNRRHCLFGLWSKNDPKRQRKSGDWRLLVRV